MQTDKQFPKWHNYTDSFYDYAPCQGCGEVNTRKAQLKENDNHPNSFWYCRDCWNNIYLPQISEKLEESLEVNLILPSKVLNFPQSRLLTLDEAREKFNGVIKKDCFVKYDGGKILWARCLWCQEYSSNLKQWFTSFDQDIVFCVAGHAYDCRTCEAT